MRFLDGDKDISGWKPEPNSIEGGNAYAQYIKDAFNTGYIIRSFWCNPVDSPKGFGKFLKILCFRSVRELGLRSL